MSSMQKAGGLAALLHAVAYVVGMIVGLTLIFPLLDAAPDRYLRFLSGNQALVYVWNLISYWGSAITVVIMVLALYERLKTNAPALAQTAAAFGLIWAGLIIASGNLMLHDVGVLAELYNQNPAQALTAWTALQPVEVGITSGNELVGSFWVLLLSVAALRTGQLSRALNWFGLIVGVVGMLTIVPALYGSLAMAFGPGMIVWSMWVGIVLLRRMPVAAARSVEPTMPLSRTTPLSR
ncbi:MAG: DUF4386 family protein [Anaerolineae bacterium]|jgi:hypothetical protein|nr:DUF4386 family protein [Anaerolineae bacterium]